MINRHPNSDALVEYTSGTLSLAPTIAITTHLQFCDACTGTIESMNQVGGDLLESADALPVSDDLFDKVLHEIEQDDAVTEASPATPHKPVDEVGNALPAFVQGLLPEGDLPWKFLSPSLRVANISVGESKFELALHRIKAGGKAPEHNHNGEEVTVVLTGSFSDEDGIYHPGDYIIRKQGDVHRPIAAQNEECICLSVLAAPIRLTGAKRLINPFLSFTPS